jgi:hypothetical protein
LVALSCGFQEQRAEVEAVSTQYMEAIKRSDFDAAIALSSEKMFANTTRDDWRALSARVFEKLGPLQSFEVSTKLMMSGSDGRSATVHVKSVYEKYQASEVLTLEAQGDSPFRVAGHNINSDGFIKE